MRTIRKKETGRKVSSMFNAVVPVSDSVDQYQGVAMAKSLTESMPVSVDLVTVIDEGATAQADDERRASAEQFLQRQAERFSDATIVRRRVRTGDPTVEILATVDEVPGSFLVLSPRWADESRSFKPDSLSASLMRSSSVPVLLSTTENWPRSLTLDNIMIPVTWATPSASQILELSHAIGQDHTVFRLVYIVTGEDPGDLNEELAPPPRHGAPEEGVGYQARWRLMDLAGDLRSRGIRSTWEVRFGAPEQELSRAATTTGANLIVFHSDTVDVYSKDLSELVVLQVSHDATTPALLIPTQYALPSLRGDRVSSDDLSFGS